MNAVETRTRGDTPSQSTCVCLAGRKSTTRQTTGSLFVSQDIVSPRVRLEKSSGIIFMRTIARPVAGTGETDFFMGGAGLWPGGGVHEWLIVFRIRMQGRDSAQVRGR